MGTKKNITYLFVFLVHFGYSQYGHNQIGAKAGGVAHANAANSDSWGLFYNPAGISDDKITSSLLMAYDNKYNISEINSVAIGFTTKTKIGTIGSALYNFGNNNYNEQIISLAFSNKMGIASLGFRINYLQYHIDELGYKGLVVFDVGGIAEITNRIFIGAYIRNISQTKISNTYVQYVPSFFYLGIKYVPIKKLFLLLETEKDLDKDNILKFGVEYQFLKKFWARTGVKTNEITNYIGLSFQTKKLNIDYAFSLNQRLGINNEISILYHFSK